MRLLNKMTERKKIILIFLLAFLFRLLLIKFIPFPFYPERVDDAHVYDVMAANIWHGNGFSDGENPPYTPVIVRTPGYPFFLAGIYALFGQAYDMVRIIQALIDSLTCFLVYLICLLCFEGKKNCNQLALLAFIIAALCPFTAFFVSLLYNQTLTAFLFTLSVYLFILAMVKKKQRYYFLSGITIALAFLCRPATFIYPFLLVMIMLLANIRNKPIPIFKNISIYILAVCLAWLPWVYRNYIVFGKFVPLSLCSGSYLWLATYPPARYAEDFALDKEKYDEFAKLDGKAALDMDAQLGKEAIERIKKEPLKYFQYSLRRTVILWISSYSTFIQIEESFADLFAGLKTADIDSRAKFQIIAVILIKGLLTALNLILVLAGVVGIIITFRFWKIIYPAVLVPIYITLSQAPIGHANPRYTTPAWPIFLIFSAYGLWSIAKKTGLIKDA